MDNKIIIAIISAVSLTVGSVIGWLSTRRKNNAEADATIADRFTKIIKTLQDGQTAMAQQIAEANKTIATQQKEIDELKRTRGEYNELIELLIEVSCLAPCIQQDKPDVFYDDEGLCKKRLIEFLKDKKNERFHQVNACQQ